MSNTKRSQDSAADSNKKQKTEASSVDDEEKIFNALQEYQDKINDLTLQASEEVIQIEQKYNEQRKPLYAQRAEMLKKIPSFWKVVLCTAPELANDIVEEDIEVLDYLEDVSVEDKIKAGFKFTFTFKPNPFFKNTTLTKELKWQDNNDQQISVVTTPIQWKKNDPKLQEGFIANLFSDSAEADLVELSEVIKESIWPDPLALYIAGTQEVGEDEYEDEDQ